MSRQTALRALALPVLLLGAALFVFFLVWPVPLLGMRLLLTLLFVGLTLALASIEISLGGRISLSPEIAAVILAILLVSPGAGAISVIASSTATGLRRKRSTLRIGYTVAQFVLSIGIFVLIYVALVGPEFGPLVPEQALQSGWGAVGRYTLAVALGTAAYVLLNDALILAYIRLESGEGLDTWAVIRGDVGGSLALLVLVIPAAFAVGAFGVVTVLFAVPILGVVWGSVVLARARLTQGSLSVTERLTAFFTASIGAVFVLLSAVVLSTFVDRYTGAVVRAQAALGSGLVGAIEEATQPGEPLRLTPATASALRRLVAGSPELAYAVLLLPGEAGLRPAAAELSAEARPFGERIQQTLLAEPDREQRRWTTDEASLSVRELRLPVGAGSGAAGELRLGLNLAAVERDVRSLAFLLGGITLVLFVLLLFLLRRYTERGLGEPLRHAGGALQRIAQGEADLTERLPTAGDRELVALGGYFNQFADKLVDIVSTTSHAAHAVAGGAENIAASSQQLAASAALVADSMGNAVTRLEQERGDAAELHRLTTGLRDLNAEVAERTLQATREAAAVVQTAEQSSDRIGGAGAALLEIRAAVRESASASAGLIQAARQIAEFTQNIRGIADQTNLLALNAAIEAARAGEHGRGFAVVAEEVRKLADQSATASARVGEMLDVVSRHSDQVARAMQAGESRVAGVERISTESREALESVVEAVRRIDAAMREVSERMVRERDIVARVDAQVSAIEYAIADNATAAAEVGAATEEQTASVDHMAELSQQMVEEARLLQHMVGRFRLPEQAGAV